MNFRAACLFVYFFWFCFCISFAQPSLDSLLKNTYKVEILSGNIFALHVNNLDSLALVKGKGQLLCMTHERNLVRNVDLIAVHEKHRVRFYDVGGTLLSEIPLSPRCDSFSVKGNYVHFLVEGKIIKSVRHNGFYKEDWFVYDVQPESGLVVISNRQETSYQLKDIRGNLIAPLTDFMDSQPQENVLSIRRADGQFDVYIREGTDWEKLPAPFPGRVMHGRNEVFLVWSGKHWGAMNQKGELVIPIAYNEIRNNISPEFLFARNDTSIHVFDLQGDFVLELFPFYFAPGSQKLSRPGGITFSDTQLPSPHRKEVNNDDDSFSWEDISTRPGILLPVPDLNNVNVLNDSVIWEEEHPVLNIIQDHSIRKAEWLYPPDEPESPTKAYVLRKDSSWQVKPYVIDVNGRFQFQYYLHKSRTDILDTLCTPARSLSPWYIHVFPGKFVFLSGHKTSFLTDASGKTLSKAYSGINHSLNSWPYFIMRDSSGKYGLIDSSGAEVFSCAWNDADFMINENETFIRICTESGKWGIMNGELDWVLKPEYDYIRETRNFPVVVKSKGKALFMNKKGETLLELPAENRHLWMITGESEN